MVISTSPSSTLGFLLDAVLSGNLPKCVKACVRATVSKAFLPSASAAFLLAATRPLAGALEGEGFVLDRSLKLQPIMKRKPRRQELEAADHTASTGRKQKEMNTDGQLTHSLIQSGIPAHGMGLSVAREALPTSISLI